MKLFEQLQDVTADLFGMMGFALLAPISQTYFDPTEIVTTGDPNKDIPIILVHGFMHNSSGMIFLRKRLNRRGFKNVFTVDMGMIPFGVSIEDYAENLRARVSTVLRSQEHKELRLIGHSMGGLTAAYYALQIAPRDGVNVRDVVTLGSPLKGTRTAAAGLGPSARQMSVDSPFVQRLSAEIKGSDVAFHHFASKTDLFMRPYHTSLNGQDGKQSRQHVVHGGHLAYLYSREVAAMIASAFDK